MFGARHSVYPPVTGWHYRAVCARVSMRQIAFVRHVWPQNLTDSLAVGVTIHVLPMKSCSKSAKDAQKILILSSDHDHFQVSIGNINLHRVIAHGYRRLHTIAQGYDDIKIVMVDVSTHLPFTFLAN